MIELVFIPSLYISTVGCLILWDMRVRSFLDGFRSFRSVWKLTLYYAFGVERVYLLPLSAVLLLHHRLGSQFMRASNGPISSQNSLAGNSNLGWPLTFSI